MNNRQLKFFQKLYEIRSFTKVAEFFNIAQPAISKAIIDLEEEINSILFERIGKSLIPTTTADLLYKYTEDYFTAYDRILTNIKNNHLETVKIGSSLMIGSYILPILIQNLKIKYPTLNVQCTISDSTTIEKSVLASRIDIGIIEGANHFKNLIYSSFKKDNLVFVCNIINDQANQEVSIKELEHFPIISRRKGSASREILDSFCEQNNLYLNYILESDSNEAIKSFINQNLGIGFLPYLLVEEEVKNKKFAIIKVENTNFERVYKFVYRKDFVQSEYLSYLLEQCTKIQ